MEFHQPRCPTAREQFPQNSVLERNNFVCDKSLRCGGCLSPQSNLAYSH